MKHGRKRSYYFLCEHNGNDNNGPIRMICLQTNAVTANGKKQQIYGKHRSNGDSIHHCCAGLYLVQAWLHGRPIRPEVIINSYRHNMSGIDFVVGNG